MVAPDGGVCFFEVKLEGVRGIVVDDRLRGRSGQDGGGGEKMKEIITATIGLNEYCVDSGTRGEALGDVSWKSKMGKGI
jgi:hypothetical protein